MLYNNQKLQSLTNIGHAHKRSVSVSLMLIGYVIRRYLLRFCLSWPAMYPVQYHPVMYTASHNLVSFVRDSVNWPTIQPTVHVVPEVRGYWILDPLSGCGAANPCHDAKKPFNQSINQFIRRQRTTKRTSPSLSTRSTSRHGVQSALTGAQIVRRIVT